MVTGELSARRLRVVWVACLVVGFWAFVVIAGIVNPGYLQRRDYISALASRGAVDAWLGVAALVVLPGAHLVTALLLRTYARLAATGLLVSVVAGLVVAVNRIGCPAGAARCSTPSGAPRQTDWMDAVHGRAVGAYGVVMVLVLALAAYETWNRPGFRQFALTSGLLAPVSGSLLAASAGGANPGAPQRLWLLVNTGWLVAAARRSR